MAIFSATVKRVTDGDTVQLLIDCNLRILGISQFTLLPCRLLRVNTPELNSPDEDVRKRAVEAKTFLEGVLLGGAVTIHPKALDPYKRPLVELYVGSTNINDLVIKSGYGVVVSLKTQMEKNYF